MKRFIPLLLLLIFGACSSMSDVIRDKDEGTAKVYALTQDQAWDVAVHVFRWNGADAIEQHKDEHYMLTSTSKRPFASATYMGAWVEPADPGRVKVTVVTKRKVSYKITTSLTEAGFHEDFAKAAAILQSGKPLPIEAP